MISLEGFRFIIIEDSRENQIKAQKILFENGFVWADCTKRIQFPVGSDPNREIRYMLNDPYEGRFTIESSYSGFIRNSDTKFMKFVNLLDIE